MNIVLFSPSWPLHGSANGITSYCSHIARGLNDAGHTVIIVTAELIGRADENVYQLTYKPGWITRAYLSLVEHFFKGYRQYYIYTRSILSTMNEIGKTTTIDIIEIEESFGWHYYLQNQLKCPVILRLHGPHFVNVANSQTTPNNFDRRRILREERAFKSAKYITAPSQWAINAVQNEYRIAPRLSEVIPNSIDLVKKDLRWNISSYTRLQILFVGRFDEVKGADILLEAFSHVLRSYPNATLYFAGPDIGITIKAKKLYFDDYVNQLFTPQEQDNIKYCGLVSPGAISQLRRQSHITVLSSRHEVFCYAALEALAHCTPVIVSNVGGLTEVLDNSSGVFFEPKNALDLSQKISALFEDEDRLQSLSKNGRLRCRSMFSNQRIALKSASNYQKVIFDYRLYNE
jgi:glycosyltransferase involved in cell wall biosynthesis